MLESAASKNKDRIVGVDGNVDLVVIYIDIEDMNKASYLYLGGITPCRLSSCNPTKIKSF